MKKTIFDSSAYIKRILETPVDAQTAIAVEVNSKCTNETCLQTQSLSFRSEKN